MTSTAPPPAAAIDVRDHLSWAEGVARGVGLAYMIRPGSQEAADLAQVAYLTLLRYARAFDHERVPAGGDPAGAFRGYCHRDVRKEVQREARRLRNGGTYRTRREVPGVSLLAIPTSDFDEASDPFEVAEPQHRAEALPDPDPAEPPSRFCVCLDLCICATTEEM
jgi:hypothetical protein